MIPPVQLTLRRPGDMFFGRGCGVSEILIIFAVRNRITIHRMFSEHQTPKTLREILSQNCTPSDRLVAALEEAAVHVRVAKGKAVVRQGEVFGSFVFIRKGLFRVSHDNQVGEDTILFGTSGDVFTALHSYYANEPAVFSLIAVEDSEVWLVSFEDMRHILSAYPDMMMWMHNLMIEQIYAFEKRYMFFSNKSAEERFINFLRDRYGSLRRAPIKYISSIVPLKYIAQYLKITQSTLSRLRKKLVSNQNE